MTTASYLNGNHFILRLDSREIYCSILYCNCFAHFTRYSINNIAGFFCRMILHFPPVPFVSIILLRQCICLIDMNEEA